MDDETLASLSAAELEKMVEYHNKLYWDEHRTEITDYEYDRLVRRLRELAPDSKVLQKMGPTDVPPTDASTAVKHKAPMLSLDKCYSAEELHKWLADFEGEVLMSPKFDGIACSLHFDAHGRLHLAATRGDGELGENITANARVIKDIPHKISAKGVEVRGEVFMRASVFEKFKAEGFANPRNLAAGAIKQKSVEKSAAYGLSFAAYDLLGSEHSTEKEKLDALTSWGFPPFERTLLARDALVKGYEDLAARRASLDFEIDGVVFKANRVSEQKRLGSTSHHPRYAIAYKFQGDSGTTVLRDIEWSVARSGAVTPVAIIDPVNLSGVSVSRASLHHPGFLEKLALTRNSEVVVMRRGGVIPNVEFVAKQGEGKFEIPTKCPSCGGEVRKEKDFLFCAKPATCRSAIIGQLSHFAAATGMLGFGDRILELAYDAKLLRRPADFFTLEAKALSGLERLGEKTAVKLVKEVDKARNLELATFLRAFGLPELGKNVSTLLSEHFGDLDKVLALEAAQLAAIHGVGPVIAAAVVSGLAEAREEIEAVRKFVTLSVPAAQAKATEGPWAGLSFVFTGTLGTMTRKDAEKIVRSLGGTAADSVSKALTYLVVGGHKTEEKSSKQKAAEKLLKDGASLTILTEEAFHALAEAAKKASPAAPAAPSTSAEKPAEKAAEPAPAKAPEKPAEKPAEPKAKQLSLGEVLAPTPKPAEKKPLFDTPLPAKGEGLHGGEVVLVLGKLPAELAEKVKARVEERGAALAKEWSDKVTHVVLAAKGKPGPALSLAREAEHKGHTRVLDEAHALAWLGLA